MPPKKLDPADEIEAMSDLIDECNDALSNQNLTPDQRKLFTQLYSASRDAYWMASEAGFSKSNAYIVTKTKELAEANQELKDDLQSLQDLSETLQKIETAVSTALVLAALLA
ncbi:MAG: hypothetical protein ABL962_16605 [Fimbriimonadaceae bacterium]